MFIIEEREGDVFTYIDCVPQMKTAKCARSSCGVPTKSEADNYDTFVMVVKSQWGD